MSNLNEIVRRWSKPANIAGVRESPDAVEVRNGKPRREIEWTLGDQDTEDRVRLGYLCMNCMEPHEQPFPEMCAVCKFPMREHQRRLFEIRHKGERHIGPSVKLSDEFDRLDAEHEQDKWAEHPTLGIVVPRNSISRG